MTAAVTTDDTAMHAMSNILNHGRVDPVADVMVDDRRDDFLCGDWNWEMENGTWNSLIENNSNRDDWHPT